MQHQLFRATQALRSQYGKKAQPSFQEQFQTQVLPKLEHFCTNMTGHKAFIASAIVTGTCLPLSILFAPSFLAIPFDLALSLALPFHMYYGTNLVLEDYVPKQYRANTLKGWAALSVIAAYGLIKISICGPGLGASVRSLWAPPKVVQSKRLD